MDNGGIRLYEQADFREVTGESIHPGGLELTERALALCSLPPGAAVLDVACGTGASVEWLRAAKNIHAIGLDASELMLQVGLQRCQTLPFACGKSCSLPIASGQLEAILVECSLSLMPDIDRVLSEFLRVLKPGGMFIASDLYLRNPPAAGPLRALPVVCCLKGAQSQAEITDNIQSRGFEIEVWEDHSVSLKAMMSQISGVHGSIQAFWSRSLPDETDLFELQLAIARAQPGYYLLIAKKGQATKGWASGNQNSIGEI